MLNQIKEWIHFSQRYNKVPNSMKETDYHNIIKHISDCKNSEAIAQKVVHHHIMKTGGTSFNAMLDRQFSGKLIMQNYLQAKNCFSEWNLEFTPENLTKVLAQYDLIHDHVCLLKFLPQDYEIVTFFRDPVTRAYSLYNDWKSLQENNIAHNPPRVQEDKRSARELPIDQFIARERRFIKMQFHNGMCRSFLRGPFTDKKQLFAMTDDELFAAAQKQVLSRIKYFGLTEHFVESVALIYCSLGWQPPSSLKEISQLNVRNSRKGREKLTDSQRSTVLSFNRADQKLYDWARAEFFKKLGYVPDSPEVAVANG